MHTEQIDFDRVTAGLKTKSEKIRALSRSGARTADIARYLGIRYQHARNVLMQAGLHRTAGEAADGPAEGTPKPVWLNFDNSGRLALPADLLAAAGLAPGDPVYVRVSEDGIEMLSRRGALGRAREIASRFVPPGVSVVDEFIADRRREAEREND